MTRRVTTPQRPVELALDGDDVRRALGAPPGREIGDALRWLEQQVAENPQLNTREALTALLAFGPYGTAEEAER